MLVCRGAAKTSQEITADNGLLVGDKRFKVLSSEINIDQSCSGVYTRINRVPREEISIKKQNVRIVVSYNTAMMYVFGVNSLMYAE
jgi:hypothetical protein